MSTTDNATNERDGNAVTDQAVAARPVGARLHLVGGTPLDVLQGTQVARRRLEAAHEAGEAYAAFTQPPSGPIFVNPLHVKYLAQPQEGDGQREARIANARIHFTDGSSLDVLQGSGVANKRLSEARSSLGLFATFADPHGNQVFVNCLAVTHLAPDLGAAAAAPAATAATQQAPQRGKKRTRTT